jgi:hypothetical protein
MQRKEESNKNSKFDYQGLLEKEESNPNNHCDRLKGPPTPSHIYLRSQLQSLAAHETLET